MSSVTGIPWRRPMTGRDRDEEHRASTPLELLFDLCFVVAVAGAASSLHHGLTEGHFGHALLGYLTVFFAIWWAWMNFTWFASAYDTDDVAYRLLTFVQMTGALVLAAGVPRAFDRQDFAVVTVGYVIMRLAMLVQWLRVWREHRARRTTAEISVAGIAVVQALWVARLFVPGVPALLSFVVLALLDAAVPVVAERRGGATPWHPGHIAERYGLFTIIVLGEVILATSTSLREGVVARGLSSGLVMLSVGALLLVFGMWWLYFKRSVEESLALSAGSVFVWGYGHYLIFGSVAAVGAGLGAMTDVATGVGHAGARAVGTALAIAVATYLLVLSSLHLRAFGQPLVVVRAAVASAVVLGLGALGPAPGPTVLLMGVTVAATVAVHVVADRPPTGRPDPAPDPRT
jgi:low temperature requirement protein LtrA